VAADLLTRAGVGRLELVDRDTVEISNLQRQTLYSTADVGEAKAVAAGRRLAQVNPGIGLGVHTTDVNAGNVLDLIAGATVVIDATDNAQTRYLINDATIRTGLPWVYGAAVGTVGRVAGFWPGGGGACLRCLFWQPPAAGELPTCDTAGVLNTATATIGALQANTCLRLICQPQWVPDTLLSVDLWTQRFATIAMTDPGCPACRGGQLDFLNSPVQPAVSLCGRNTVQILAPKPTTLDLVALAARWAPLGEVRGSRHMVRLHPAEDGQVLSATIFTDGRMLIEFVGAGMEEEARGLYDRWVGT